jgi:hypothetical protein
MGRGILDFQQAMANFVIEAIPYMDSRRRVLEMLNYVEAECHYLALGDAARPRDLFDLWYHKAYIPAYVGMRLLLEDEDEEEVRTYAKLVGAGFQFADDLIDVVEDMRAGLFWITTEELNILGVHRSQCLTLLESLTALREQICLTYFFDAYERAARLHSSRNRRLAELTIEQFFRCVKKGRFHVYPGRRKNYYGIPGIVLPYLPGCESAKYHLLHSCFEVFRHLPIKLADLDTLRHRAERSAFTCPASLAPEVCLAVMNECEQAWRSKDLINQRLSEAPQENTHAL